MRLLLAFLAFAALLPIRLAFADPGPATRPNFLFVYTDDQRWDAMSVVQREQGDAGRFPWLKTPNMDRLAAEGIRFRNAFVVNSLCAPSRSIFLTGRYSHLNGVANNHTPFPMENVTYAALLRQAGYTTGYFGKFHHGSQPTPRPGFDFSASFIGQGQYMDCPIEVNGVKTPSKGWVDDVTTDYAIEFLKKSKEKPFAIVVGYKACHGPWTPPERLKDAIPDVVSKPPVNADAKPPFKEFTVPGKGGAAKKAGGEPAAGKKAAQDRSAMQRNYFRTIMGADENFGRLLQTLDELKLVENTVVVFTSDNGFYLGDHGLGDKRSAYDESLRIPFIVRYPKMISKGGQTRDEMVLNLDVAPTFLDLAGIAVPKEMQGMSMKPLLDGSAKDWRHSWFYEYFFERGFAQPTTLAVRTDTAKLIKYPGHDEWTELFDLKADPYEMKNLYNDPKAAELRKMMEAEYDARQKAVGFVVPSFADKPGDSPTTRPAAPAGNKPAAGGAAAPAIRRAGGPTLQYDLGAPETGTAIVDHSKSGNNGEIHGKLPLADGRDGKKARQFDGKSYIEVPVTAGMDPANAAINIEITFLAEKPDGVLIARGGKTAGFAIVLEKGKPTFVLNSNNKSTQVQLRKEVTGAWTTVTAAATKDHRLTISADGALGEEQKLPALIAKDPNNGMQIGADEGSPVSEVTSGFVGKIDSVRVTMQRGE
jgi:arylsulfatase A-like enzyme